MPTTSRLTTQDFDHVAKAMAPDAGWRCEFAEQELFDNSMRVRFSRLQYREIRIDQRVIQRAQQGGEVALLVDMIGRQLREEPDHEVREVVAPRVGGKVLNRFDLIGGEL